MDQEAIFARCLEELNYALTEPEFDAEKTYAILKELCVAFRVCKGMAEYYRGEKEERKGEGVIRVCTSVDDFGIGYSSLNLIKEIPWDIIKVDRKFLQADDEPAQDRQAVMFRHVISMAKDLGLTCVAEGVETPGQLAILRENGCEIAQGFYFDKPLPVKVFEQRMDRHLYPQS